MAKRGRGRPKIVRSAEEQQLVKEVQKTRARLKARAKYIEKHGHGNQYTKEVLGDKMSVKGLNKRGLKSLHRKIKHQLTVRSTTSKGAKEVEKVSHIIDETINIKSKSSRSRVNQLIQRAYEEYPALRDKKYRYEIRNIVNKLIEQKRHNKTILDQLRKIMEETSANGDEGFEKAREQIFEDFDISEVDEDFDY